MSAPEGFGSERGAETQGGIMNFDAEISAGQRFEFGKNWQRYIAKLDQAKLEAARTSLINFLGDLRGRSFFDAGSGSGIFSLAAVQLGAIVHSIDYDPYSVACTRMLKERFAAQSDWVIERGSVLDKPFLEHLGCFDVVYCWGVLHHTGDMWTALDNVAASVRSHGQLWISIYNDQGRTSRCWKSVKRTYNKGRIAKALVLSIGFTYFVMSGLMGDLFRMRNPLSRYRQARERGMDVFRDWIDWLGGWPFEVAKPEQIFDFCTQRGFTLRKLLTRGGGLGCNQFLFAKDVLKADFAASDTNSHTAGEYQKSS
jgi:2-polyprenyl-3-methyl-5-hydroxy-6-metoxy-1,4-benzoquinol methylase